MKRTGYLFEKVCDIENIKLAIENSSKGKKNRKYVSRTLKDKYRCALRIQQILLSGNYDLGHSHTRIIHDKSSGKERNITIPRFFPDQIIHWAVMQVIIPIISKGMYKYCCSSVPKRGAIYAKRKIENILKTDKSIRYVMKLDIKKFFPTISHEKFKTLLRKKIKDYKMIKLIDCIIDTGGKGLPIGYYSSQWFSNFYLQEFDTFVKQDLKIKHYIRYADDMVFLGSNKKKLRKALTEIKKYLSVNGYGIAIKENRQIWKMGSRPIDFVGYRFYPNYTLLRKKIFYRLMKCVRKIDNQGINIHLARQYASLIGWASHINFGQYYQTAVYPIVSTKFVKEYIGRWDRNNNLTGEREKRGAA